jgi:hypothetical protein
MIHSIIFVPCFNIYFLSFGQLDLARSDQKVCDLGLYLLGAVTLTFTYLGRCDLVGSDFNLYIIRNW